MLALVLLVACTNKPTGILNDSIILEGRVNVETDSTLQDDTLKLHEKITYFTQNGEDFGSITEEIDSQLLDNDWIFEESGKIGNEVYAVYYRCPHEDLTLSFHKIDQEEIQFAVMVMTDTSLTRKKSQ